MRPNVGQNPTLKLYYIFKFYGVSQNTAHYGSLRFMTPFRQSVFNELNIKIRLEFPVKRRHNLPIKLINKRSLIPFIT